LGTISQGVALGFFLFAPLAHKNYQTIFTTLQ